MSWTIYIYFLMQKFREETLDPVGGRRWGGLYPKVRLIGIISLIALAAFSFSIFFYIQQRAEDDLRTSLFEREKDAQLEATRRMSEHIGSDLNLVISTLDGLANSRYLQVGDFYSLNARSLIAEKYNELNPRINRLLVLDKNNVVTISHAPPNLESFLSSDLSLRDWVIETRKGTQPVFSDAFERQGIYRIFISYPIISRDTGDFLGMLAVSIPTVPYFSYYANVLDVNSQFLVAFNKQGTLLAVGASQDLVGENFFGEKTQEFINHDPTLNNLTKILLAGNSGYAIYDYGRGERITTQYPIYVGGEPTYFIQLITPTAQLYSQIDATLQEERTRFFLLLLGTLLAIAVLATFLTKLNAILGREVQSRTEQLETANSMLNQNLHAQKEFLDIAAHELRNPVQPILGLAEVLQARASESMVEADGFSSDSGFRDKQMLDAIVRNAKRLHKLTEDLLDASRIDSGSLRLNKEVFDLSKAVAMTLQDFTNSRMDARKINIIGTPAESMLVNADRDRIIQVLSNLLNNSEKFVKEGTIHVGLKREDSYAVVTIRDDGEGIHPDVLPRLFGKFVTKSDHGTGLGLFISKGIVEAHSGQIWAENNPDGKGASFHFKLPLAT
jgi:signal transduction histidine kinase